LVVLVLLVNSPLLFYTHPLIRYNNSLVTHMEKIAVISDIHGNMPALETVLQDIRGRGIKRIFCLGDLAGKGPHGEKVIDICREKCEGITLGNWDFVVADGSGPSFLNLGWHRARLGAER